MARSVIGFLLPLLMLPGNHVAGPQPMSGTTGFDISYPNCRTALPKTDFGVVGVNGGRAYTYNDCFLQQAMTFTRPAFYLNTGWNGKSDSVTASYPKRCAANDMNCLAYNYGYNAGLQAYDFANHQWQRSNTWWLDVETMNSWSDDTVQNQYSLQGEHDALVSRGVATVGAYSTSHQWSKITGGWQNGWSNWGATVVTTKSEAVAFCHDHEFTGGPTLLVQYRPKEPILDHDVAC